MDKVSCICIVSGPSLIARFMGPTWGRQDPGGPHVGPMNFAIWDSSTRNHVGQLFQFRSSDFTFTRGRFADRYWLTHWGLMAPWVNNSQGNGLLSDSTKWWHKSMSYLISELFLHSPKSNFTASAQAATVLCKGFEHYILKSTATYPRVNELNQHLYYDNISD